MESYYKNHYKQIIAINGNKRFKKNINNIHVDNNCLLVGLALNCYDYYRLLIQKTSLKSKLELYNKSRETHEHARNTSLSHGNTFGTVGSYSDSW